MGLEFLNQFLPTKYQQEPEKETPENDLEELQKVWLKQQAENYTEDIVQAKQAITGVRVVATTTLSIYIGIFSAITVGLPAALGFTLISSVPNFIGISKRVSVALLLIALGTVTGVNFNATTMQNRAAVSQARQELQRFDDETNLQGLLIGSIALTLLLGYATKSNKSTKY